MWCACNYICARAVDIKVDTCPADPHAHANPYAYIKSSFCFRSSQIL
jgi:hypothetical protein